MKAKKIFEKTNKRVELKKEMKSYEKIAHNQMDYSRCCDVKLHICNSYGWVQTQ